VEKKLMNMRMMEKIRLMSCRLQKKHKTHNTACVTFYIESIQQFSVKIIKMIELHENNECDDCVGEGEVRECIDADVHDQ